MADLSTALTTGAFTLTAALGGVLVTQRYVARQAVASRIEDRRAALRAVLTDLIVNADAHIEGAKFFLPVMTKLTNRDLLEYAETDSLKESDQRMKALNRAITTALLYIADEDLAEATRSFQVDLQAYPERAVGPLIDQDKTAEQRSESLRASFVHLAKMHRSVRHLESEAAKVLRVPITDRAPRRSSWFRRRPAVRAPEVLPKGLEQPSPPGD
ncbi:hypothetical protein ABZS29_26760 [Kribbella sp. NPDC005582]|uniref:hypothetical protein n=1 Tax=Kribbella sp. NPDC005582 TaxID=3156893 RepID=UPI0033AFF7A4